MKKNLFTQRSVRVVGLSLFIFSVLFFSLFVITQKASAQNQLVKQWDYRFGGTSDDQVTCFLQTADGGYIMGGCSTSPVSGDKTQPVWGGANYYDYWIVKVDASGIEQWNKDFGGTGTDELSSIQQTSDGGYILGGWSYSSAGGDKTQNLIGSIDYWIIKTDWLGNKQWDKDFGGTSYNYLYSIQQTSDGGYILGGYSSSGIGGDKTEATHGGYDYWMVKTDSLGNKQWDKDFGGIDYDQMYSIQQTSDGGFILGGYSNSSTGGDKTQNTHGSYDYWIVKTDAFGIKQWDKDFGGTSTDELFSIKQTFDGGYILGGWSYSGAGGDKTQPSWGSEDYWIVKTDAFGIKQWDKDFGGTSYEEWFGNVSQTSDGGYLISGSSDSDQGGDKSENNLGISQGWVIKTDSLGSKQWDKTIFTSPDGKVPVYSLQTDQGCYVIAKPTYGNVAGYKTQPSWNSSGGTDYWIIKFCDTTFVVAPPNASFVANPYLCPGTCTSFLNLTTHATSYQWTFAGANPSTSTDMFPANICYNTPGTYDVQLIATNTIGSDTLLLANYITVYPAPPGQSITQSGDTLFAIAGAPSYQWYFNSTAVNGATDYYYVATASGDYNVVATDTNGCEVEAAVFNVIAGLTPTLFKEEGVTATPNPFTDNIKVSSAGKIFIYDSIGKKLFEKTISFSNEQLDLSFLQSGIYFLKIETNGKTFQKKIVKL